MQSSLSELIGNRVLWAAVAGWLVAQGIKVLLALIVTRKFEPSYIFASGGMPSSHSALVMGLATGVARVNGCASRCNMCWAYAANNCVVVRSISMRLVRC